MGWSPLRSRSATSPRSTCPTTASTSCTPTRCSSTCATRWVRSPRCAGCAARRAGGGPGRRLRRDDLVSTGRAARAVAGAVLRGGPRQRRGAGRRAAAAVVGVAGRVHRGHELRERVVLRVPGRPRVVGLDVGRPDDRLVAGRPGRRPAAGDAGGPGDRRAGVRGVGGTGRRLVRGAARRGALPGLTGYPPRGARAVNGYSWGRSK